MTSEVIGSITSPLRLGRANQQLENALTGVACIGLRHIAKFAFQENSTLR